MQVLHKWFKYFDVIRYFSFP
jgi:hypothetical protein